MSGRLALRIASVGLLAMAFATPAVAQEGGFQTPPIGEGLPIPESPFQSGPLEIFKPLTAKPMPEAPMPRVKGEQRIEIEVTFGAMNGIALKWSLEAEPIVLPQEPAKPLCCIGECCSRGWW